MNTMELQWDLKLVGLGVERAGRPNRPHDNVWLERGYWLLGLIILVSSWDTGNHNLTTTRHHLQDQEISGQQDLLRSLQ